MRESHHASHAHGTLHVHIEPRKPFTDAGKIINTAIEEHLPYYRSISKIFMTIGIPANIKGYQFLREAIIMTVKQHNIINNITKQLYPQIAEKYETTPSKVERAIRHAIEVGWGRGRLDELNRIFGVRIYSKNDRPTNGEFIALIADKLLVDGTNI